MITGYFGSFLRLCPGAPLPRRAKRKAQRGSTREAMQALLPKGFVDFMGNSWRFGGKIWDDDGKIWEPMGS